MAKSLKSGRARPAYKAQPAPRRVSVGSVSHPVPSPRKFTPENDPGRALTRVKLT